jgi:hypothetical protein
MDKNYAHLVNKYVLNEGFDYDEAEHSYGKWICGVWLDKGDSVSVKQLYDSMDKHCSVPFEPLYRLPLICSICKRQRLKFVSKEEIETRKLS